jgi:hypothetical protein
MPETFEAKLMRRYRAANGKPFDGLTNNREATWVAFGEPWNGLALK